VKDGQTKKKRRGGGGAVRRDRCSASESGPYCHPANWGEGDREKAAISEAVQGVKTLEGDCRRRKGKNLQSNPSEEHYSDGEKGLARKGGPF